MKRFIYLLFFCGVFFFGLNGVNAADIADGVYKIQSALDSNKVIDVSGGHTEDGTNIQLYQFNNSNAQKWEVKSIGNNYYTITSMLDNTKSMDVRYGGFSNGTNVQLHTFNDSNAEHWLIKYAGNGYYYIISQCNNKYIDIKNGSSSNGANIQMYQGNGSNAQKFKFVELIDIPQTPVLADGTYTISSSLSDTKVLDIQSGIIANGVNVQLYDYNKSWAQMWDVKYLGNGYYSISNALDTTKTLDVKNAAAANSTRIQIYNVNNSPAQKWLLKDAGNGYFNIVSQLDNFYMDVSGGNSKNGTAIQLYHGNATAAQKFKFNKVNAVKLIDGYYTINSVMDETKVLGLNSNTANNFTNVGLYTDNGNNSSKWYVKHLGGGLYSITNALDRSMALDVRNGSRTNGANVHLFSYNGTDAQKWYIQYNDDNSYNIITKNGGMVIDIAGAKADEGANIQMWSSNGTTPQAYKFKPTELGINDGYYTINLALNKSKVVDVNGGIKKNGTAVQVYDLNNSPAQIWYFEHVSYDYYRIRSAMNPNVVLEAAGGGTTNGTAVQIYNSNNTDAQLWEVKRNSDGTVSITSKNSGLALDVTNGNTSNGNKMQLYGKANVNAQKFILNKYTEKKVYTGMDVSVHQGDIDWDTVGNSDLGFVIIRVGYGGNVDPQKQDDSKFLRNVEGCEKNNIPYSVYLYSYATNFSSDKNNNNSSASEAEHVKRLIGNFTKESNPNFTGQVYFDYEDKTQTNLSVDTRTRIVDNFCSIMKNSGYACGLYADQTKLQTWFNTKQIAVQNYIWVAQWPGCKTFGEAKGKQSSYNLTNYKYWQFTSDGSVKGVPSARVDLNLGYDIFD